ncbi:LLM class F420-dependent oxidoreductase [soil metagenome]
MSPLSPSSEDQPTEDRPFRVDAGGDVNSSALEVEAAGIEAEEAGYDGALVTETRHDPFIGIALAARVTKRINLATSIAVAFARNPMTTAMVANDLNLLSEGRFALGLGSQIKPHIERRFSMEWSHPAARMADFVRAIRVIWQSWETGEALKYTGEFYRHTLMTPFFDPGPNPHGNPPIWLAGVGERMTEVAGEVADGFISHSFTTRRYLTEVSMPALRRGRDRAGRDSENLGICMPALVAIGADQAALDAAIQATRKQIAFYGSTPAYRPVLELHGWGELSVKLNAGSRRGEWDAMADLIDDEVLAAFAVVGAPREVATALVDRFGGLVERVSFNAPYAVAPGTFRDLLAALHDKTVSPA